MLPKETVNNWNEVLTKHLPPTDSPAGQSAPRGPCVAHPLAPSNRKVSVWTMPQLQLGLVHGLHLLLQPCNSLAAGVHTNLFHLRRQVITYIATILPSHRLRIRGARGHFITNTWFHTIRFYMFMNRTWPTDTTLIHNQVSAHKSILISTPQHSVLRPEEIWSTQAHLSKNHSTANCQSINQKWLSTQLLPLNPH